MGLDNYPDPEPCRALEAAGKLQVVWNEDGDPDCTATACPFMRQVERGVFLCWIRGKVFNKYVWECCEESLYEDKTRAELEAILPSLKECYKRKFFGKEELEDSYDGGHMRQLIEYLDTLLSIEEWDGTLVAWF